MLLKLTSHVHVEPKLKIPKVDLWSCMFAYRVCVVVVILVIVS